MTTPELSRFMRIRAPIPPYLPVAKTSNFDMSSSDMYCVYGSRLRTMPAAPSFMNLSGDTSSTYCNDNSRIMLTMISILRPRPKSSFPARRPVTAAAATSRAAPP